MSHKPADVTCREVVELVSEYLGHALSVEDRTRFDAHLETCAPCTTYLEQIKAVLSAASALGKAPTPPEVEHELLALFERWRDTRSR